MTIRRTDGTGPIVVTPETPVETPATSTTPITPAFSAPTTTHNAPDVAAEAESGTGPVVLASTAKESAWDRAMAGLLSRDKKAIGAEIARLAALATPADRETVASITDRVANGLPRVQVRNA